MNDDRHVHNCSTFECTNFYVCGERDCRDEWTCPTCEDNQHFNEINQMESELRTANGDCSESR